MKSNIKRFVLSIGATLGMALVITLGMALVNPTSSFALSAKTDITGVVTNNNSPVNGAKVVVVCNNNSRKDTTDASGSYLVQFPAKQCPAGDKATVVATKGNKGGSNGATIHADTTKLNVNIINISIPEFGLITGIAASVIGGGAYLVIRRRHGDGHQA